MDDQWPDVRSTHRTPCTLSAKRRCRKPSTSKRVSRFHAQGGASHRYSPGTGVIKIGPHYLKLQRVFLRWQYPSLIMNTNSPSHEEITQRAREIWQQSGNPGGRDTEIWLEAERQLMAGTQDSDSSSETYESPRTTSESKGAVTLSDKINSNSPSPTTVEHVIRPDDATIKATRQKKEARAPKFPTKDIPKAPPAETGKPLWDRPHSS